LVVKGITKGLVLVLSTACAHGKTETPDDLRDAFRVLERELSADDLAQFQRMEFREVSGLHFGIGMGIRNSWGLWSGESAIASDLKRRGLRHPDDMSAVILESFWLYRHGYPLRLAEQVRFYRDYWRAYETHEARFGDADGFVCIEAAADPFGPEGGSPKYDGPKTEWRCVQRDARCTRMWTAPLDDEPSASPHDPRCDGDGPFIMK
jgi:hypothetical protein